MTKKTFIKAVLLMFLMAIPLGANAEVLTGDVNGDGTVSIKDVTALINYLLTKDPTGVNLENADIYEDGRISIDDLTSLINILLKKPSEPQHEWVDLGLPSGTLWATCNVGANAPEEYGDYFAWGETEPKEVYDWSTYAWGNDWWGLTKYCSDSEYGTVDNMEDLVPEDDAAYVNWGPSWRMPTVYQQEELVNCCIWTWTTLNGVNGRMVTGPNGNTLFLPAAGYFYGSSLGYVGYYGHYWLRTLQSSFPGNAYPLNFSSDFVGRGSYGRQTGLSVRAVRVVEEPQHEYVDLGLPSGTLWATCNVGANSPEEYGDYFAWGETEAKYSYDWGTYKWCNGSNGTLTKYCVNSEYGYNGFVDNKTELDPEDDAAYVNWGPSWRMPDVEQFQELYDNCTSVRTTQNGINGLLLTGPNGNTMFLPAAWRHYYGSLYTQGWDGNYWSRTVGPNVPYGPNCAYALFFGTSGWVWDYDGRIFGFTVRPVLASQN